jgi:hypothetical protein
MSVICFFLELGCECLIIYHCDLSNIGIESLEKQLGILLKEEINKAFNKKGKWLYLCFY